MTELEKLIADVEAAIAAVKAHVKSGLRSKDTGSDGPGPKKT